MKKFTTKDRIYIENGQVMLSVTAKATYRVKRCISEIKEYDIYKEYEDGKCYCRYLYNSWVGGFYVSFPGDNTSYYKNGNGWIQEEEEFGECKHFEFQSDYIKNDEIALIASLYPDFKYTLLKCKLQRREVMTALNIWKKHPEIEFMLAAGLKKIAFTKKFWTMKESERKRVVMFIKTDERLRGYKLCELLVMMKYHLSIEQYNNFKYEKASTGVGNIGYDTYRYLVSVGKCHYDGRRLYSDYKAMLEFSNHNKNDKYWKYPKDLQQMHDKLVSELGTLEELKNRKERERKEKLYQPVAKAYSYLAGVYDGYSIFVPQDVLTIEKQAKDLHQCLVYAGYIDKVINKKCLLVFVQKDGKSIATAELYPDNKLGQFYADELDRKNCRPTKEVKKAFNKWLENKIKLEAEQKKKSA